MTQSIHKCLTIDHSVRTIRSKHLEQYIHTLLCLIVGRAGQIANFGKKPSSSFNYYKKMT